jgi:dipeptidyl aminopeptidase/acylaminoacyl peptidase
MSYPNHSFYPPAPAPTRGPNWLIIGSVVGGGGLLLLLACCGGIAYLARSPVASAAAREPFVITEVAVPSFGERGDPAEIEPGVQLEQISIQGTSDDPTGGYYTTPGHGGTINLYLPAGQHAPQSLPCVLITGAGSNLLSGMQISEADWPEHIPYVKAGYAVIAYELDGPSWGDEPEEMREAFEAFQDSRAGLVNARNALEFATKRVPEINPARIYAAGHSSAGTHALLLAAHEPRLAGVIAYAPATDLPKWFGPRLRLVSFVLPESVDFITQSSPHTHAARIKCPTFVFHAEDDRTCEIGDSRLFVEALKAQGTDATLATVPTGDHYDAMIDQGIPQAIQWLQSRP